MLVGFITRTLRNTGRKNLWKLIVNAAYRGMRGIYRFRKRLRNGRYFPAVIFISVTNQCNLSCQGCWVMQTRPPRHMEPDILDRIIDSSRKQGVYFYGLLGGEPLFYPGLFDIIRKYPDCYFQVFSNGTTLTGDIARRMTALGNITPLISIEGLEQVSDIRRGGKGVYSQSLSALHTCVRNGLFTGVATSVCKSNINELVTEDFVHHVTDTGAAYLWYYIYRPAGSNPCPELALDEDDILRLRKFIVDIRTSAPILIIDAYWDDRGRALCPAATGISIHINPDGYAEPCPPIQFAADHITEQSDIHTLLAESEFLHTFRKTAAETTRGCILLEHPDTLHNFILTQNAVDTTGRNSGIQELKSMQCLPGHHLPGREIPEKHWLYRFAKKHWFFGFGAYG